MIIGYVLLGLKAVLLFFGLLNTTLKAIRIDPWIALFFVVAFIVGGIIPMIRFGNLFTVGIGGFIVPFVLMIVMVVLVGFNSNLFRLAAAIIAVSAVSTAVLVFMPLEITWVSIIARFVIGALAGAIAYAICPDRLSSVTAALGGVVWADISAALTNYFIGATDVITLGGAVVFDAIIIGITFAVVLALVTRQMGVNHNANATGGIEAAKDEDDKDWNKYDSYLDDKD